MDRPQKLELGKVLNEISGINYNPETNTILAISDSKEKVFEMQVNTQKLSDLTGKVVPPDSDLEDLVKVDNSIFLLSSKGVIFEVPLPAKDSANVKSYAFWSTEKNDFETLYYDASVNGLIMLCKSCADGKEEEVRSAYRFDLATRTFDSTAYFSIKEKDIAALLKDDKIKFKPSAAAINPINKRLYLLVSADQLLVITDTHGEPVAAYHLNPDDHPQAEGIAFAPNGDMYISNEGKFGKATLQIYRYSAAKKK